MNTASASQPLWLKFHRRAVDTVILFLNSLLENLRSLCQALAAHTLKACDWRGGVEGTQCARHFSITLRALHAIMPPGFNRTDKDIHR